MMSGKIGAVQKVAAVSSACSMKTVCLGRLHAFQILNCAGQPRTFRVADVQLIAARDVPVCSAADEESRADPQAFEQSRSANHVRRDGQGAAPFLGTKLLETSHDLLILGHHAPVVTEKSIRAGPVCRYDLIPLRASSADVIPRGRTEFRRYLLARSNRRTDRCRQEAMR